MAQESHGHADHEQFDELTRLMNNVHKAAANAPNTLAPYYQEAALSSYFQTTEFILLQTKS